MASLTNNGINTGSVTNVALMAQQANMTWDEATFTWDEAQGTWDNPWGIANRALNTGSLTNNSADS